MKFTLALTAALCLTPAAFAQDWGNLTGQYVLDGDIPELDPLVKKDDPNAKDPAVCGKDGVPDDTLVVNEDNKGIANIVLFPSRFNDDIHPDAAKRPDNLVFDQKGCQFTPHVLIVQTGQDVLVKSDDDCAHNARSQFIRNSSFNLTIPPNERNGIAIEDLDASEPLPMPIKCDIHPYMSAYWVIVDHPYATVTDKDGKFEIKNLPAGKHTFRVWHERKGYLERSLKVEIEADETTDLGVTKVDVADLEG